MIKRVYSKLFQINQLPCTSVNANESESDLDEKLKEEYDTFLAMIKKKAFIKTDKFWYNNQKLFPNLSKLYVNIACAPSSNIFIEYYFSKCGLITYENFLDVSNDWIKTKSMFKANMNILKKMTTICN